MTGDSARFSRRCAAWMLRLSLAAFCALGAPRVGAAATETALAAPDSALAAALAALPGERLGLDEAIASALSEGSGLRLAAAAREAAAGAARRERGAFWPELFAEFSSASDEQPTASVFAGASLLETETRSASGGLRWQLPTGTQLAASLSALRSTTNSSFTSLSPQIDGVGEVSLTQPLLKGFGPGARGELAASRAERSLAEALYADARLATAAEVETAYWALYAAERDLAVQQLITEQSRSFLREVELRAQVGIVGPGAVASAQAFLAQQGQVLLDSEEQLDQLSEHLATLMGRRPGAGGRFRAQGEPPANWPAAEEGELVDLATARNLVLAAAGESLGAARARSSAARWNALPQLDLFGALGGRGLGGRGRDVIVDFGGSGPDTLRNATDLGYGDTIEQVLGRDYPSWRWGLRLSLPLGGRDRGERDRLRAEEARAAAAYEDARRALAEAVRAQHRELARSEARLALAETGVGASLEQLRIGRAEFTSGRATAFELVRLAADLADAQRRYSAALVRSARAGATLRRLTAGAYPATADTADEGGTR